MRVADDTGTRRARDSARGFQKYAATEKKLGFGHCEIMALYIKHERTLVKREKI